MLKSFKKESLKTKVWFALFAIYIIASYLAQGVILPSLVGSLTLYAFLGFSVIFILFSGSIKLSRILLWEIIFLVLSALSMLYSPEISFFGGTYYAVIVNFILVFILTQMPLTSARFDSVMITYMLSSVALIIILFLTGNLSDDSGRLGQTLFGNANIMAIMLMFSAFCAIWIFLSTNRKLWRLASFFSLLVIYFGMFLSGGRKYIVVPVVFAYVLLLSKETKSGKRRKIIPTTILLAIIAVALFLLIMKVPAFYNTIGYRFEGFFALLTGEGEVDSSTSLRMEMISAGWDKWKSSPILGYGFDSFKYYNLENVTGNFYYSHNNFIELLYNQGIVGFIGYYWFYAYIVISALKKKTDSMNKGFAIGIVASLLLFEYFGITYSATTVQFMLFFAYNRLNATSDDANMSLVSKG